MASAILKSVLGEAAYTSSGHYYGGGRHYGPGGEEVEEQTEMEIADQMLRVCDELYEMTTRQGEAAVEELARLAQQLRDMHNPAKADQREGRRGQQFLNLEQ